jgi:hypothetical protein
MKISDKKIYGKERGWLGKRINPVKIKRLLRREMWGNLVHTVPCLIMHKKVSSHISFLLCQMNQMTQ